MTGGIFHVQKNSPPSDRFLGESPAATAVLKGSALAPDITGTVRFYPYRAGSLVVAEVEGLPEHTPLS